MHGNLPPITLHAPSRPRPTSRHAIRNDTFWRRTTLVRPASDHFCHRRVAASAQTVPFRSSCRTAVFDRSRVRACHGETAQPLFGSSDRFTAVLFRRHGQRRIAKIARCDRVVLEQQSRQSIGVPWAVSGTGNLFFRPIACPRNHGRIAGGRRRCRFAKIAGKDCWPFGIRLV